MKGVNMFIYAVALCNTMLYVDQNATYPKSLLNQDVNLCQLGSGTCGQSLFCGGGGGGWLYH